MSEVNETFGEATISGYCKPEFEDVAYEFMQNFTERGEVGASVCIRIGDEKVVDLWGGLANTRSQTPWDEDSLCVVFSCTKAATAMCAHLLIERGLLDLNAPVSQYWPQFAQAGKEDITVAMMLNHSAGLPAFKDPIKANGFNDWDYMVERLEKEAPFWTPGTRNGYHMISYGWTVGELVRRVSGKSLGEFFQEEFSVPLKMDFWIGLPEDEESRVAHMMMGEPNMKPPFSDFSKAVMSNPSSVSHLALMNNGGHSANSEISHAAQIGGAGGISNARSLSRMFMPLANKGLAKGNRYFSENTVAKMGEVSVATLQDAVLLLPTRFSLGFMKSMDNRKNKPGNTESFIIGDRAFGHVGAGGSTGFADPDCNMAFAYTMNKMASGILLNERGQALVDGAYKSLGYKNNDAGIWAK
ncbi:MAG: serine hydrolase domain-containing protein [Bermanella sp.]